MTWKKLKPGSSQKRRFYQGLGEQDLSSQHGSLPFKTWELERILQYQDIAKNLINSWFAQNLKNWSIYEHILLIKYFTFKQQVIKECNTNIIYKQKLHDKFSYVVCRN